MEVTEMANVMSALQNTISISLFNKGQAGRIFNDVKKRGTQVVMKNNVPECVLMSPEEYEMLMDEVNDTRLLLKAAERMEHFDPAKLVTQEKLDQKYGITEKDLQGYEEVQIG